MSQSPRPPSASPGGDPPVATFRWRAGHPATALPGLAVLVAVGLVVALLPPSVARSGAPTAGPLVWTGPGSASNGLVNIAAENATAGARLLPSTSSDRGIAVAPEAVGEYGAGGALIAFAALATTGNVSANAWSATNASAGGDFAMEFVQPLTVHRPSGVVLVSGARAQVSVANAADDPANLSVTVTVLGWPWVHPTDSLVVNLSVAPLDLQNESLSSAGTDLLACGPTNVPGNTTARVGWAPTALAVDGAGDDFAVPVSSVAVGSPTNTTLELAVEGGSGGYNEVVTGVNLSVPTVAAAPGVPGDLVLLCVGWAAVVGAVLWAAVARFGEPGRPPRP